MVESESQIIDFERLCRLCLHEKRILMEIFESDEENSDQLSIQQKIKACSAIDLKFLLPDLQEEDNFQIQLFEGDGLPTRICVPCLSSLNAAFDFKVQCENSDKTLRNIYNLLTSDQLKEDKTLNNLDDAEVEDISSLEPKKLKYVDLSHVIVIKDQEVSQGNEEYSNKDEEETEDLLYVNYDLKNNKELNDDISFDKLISIKDESNLLSDSKDAISLQTEFKKSQCASLPVEELCLQKTQGTAERINADNLEEKSKKAELLGEAKKSACPFCHKMLTRVKEHIRLLHRNKVYICKKHNCGAEFLTLKNLQSHQLKCYNMEKQYKCLKCFKEFYRKCNYKAHIIRHSNKKDFQCQLCEKAFVDSTGLRRHFLKHHESQQEIYISGCCNKKFKTKEGLKQHIQKGICGVQIFQVVESTNENT